MQKLPKYYWDSTLFIAWIEGETRKAGEMEGLAEVVSMIDQNKAILVTSVLTRSEVLECFLSDENKGKFDALFDRTNCIQVDVTGPISSKTHDIRQYCRQKTGKKLGTADATHMATAMIYECDEMHTFDEDDMIPLSETEIVGKLKICKPKGIQMVMDLKEKE